MNKSKKKDPKSVGTMQAPVSTESEKKATMKGLVTIDYSMRQSADSATGYHLLRSCCLLQIGCSIYIFHQQN